MLYSRCRVALSIIKSERKFGYRQSLPLEFVLLDSLQMTVYGIAAVYAVDRKGRDEGMVNLSEMLRGAWSKLPAIVTKMPVGRAVLLAAFVFAIALEKWGLNRAPFMLNKKAD